MKNLIFIILLILKASCHFDDQLEENLDYNHDCAHGLLKENERILVGETPDPEATIDAENKRLLEKKAPKFKPMRITFNFNSKFEYFLL